MLELKSGKHGMTSAHAKAEGQSWSNKPDWVKRLPLDLVWPRFSYSYPQTPTVNEKEGFSSAETLWAWNIITDVVFFELIWMEIYFFLHTLVHFSTFPFNNVNPKLMAKKANV